MEKAEQSRQIAAEKEQEVKESQLKAAHMGPEGVLNWKKTPIFFVDAKRSQIAQEFQKHKS